MLAFIDLLLALLELRISLVVVGRIFITTILSLF